ncbi:MBL fold metallo-hydrolase [Aliikangiella coralliicola]|uniref:MBL fold metallo-hydrolase n=1 Tax=Aliikangiella coralliicola TaxID=2592383 RepID=A0A545UDV3_9GAMM|nr:MBL fold metallo-hydrolase [Aliikangiella coralliicola]TQV87647.1 MBL fold metallo-hydrolase [Aliikangiella coralliicola]
MQKFDLLATFRFQPIIKLVLFCTTMLTTTVQSETPNPAQSMAEFCKDLPRPEYAKLNRLKHDDDWFELYLVAPGVTAIYEPHQWQEVISYLIEGEKKALLFDTGNGLGNIAAVVKKITDKPISVLNSHTHYDHVGGNYAFDNVFGMDTDFARQRQSGHANRDIAIEASQEALCRPLPEGVTKNNHVGRPFKITQFIKDGFIFDLGNRKLEVIHIPGHTPDAVALIDRDAGLMWTGDSYYSGPIWLFAPETDLEAYAESLARLIKEVPNLKALLPAHNTPWVSPEVLRRVKRGFHTMLTGGAKLISKGEGMVEYKIPGEKQFSFLMRDEKLPYKKLK